MKQNVNYILHHKNVNLKLIETDLKGTHISIYNALFLIWNQCGFDTDLSINRNDVMKLSKIGSANTYTNCLKDLHKYKFIDYKPSYNPLIGSKIHLYRFDKGSDKGSVNSSSHGSDNGSDTLYKLLNKETIKLLNNKTYTDKINNNLKIWLDLKDKPKKTEKVFSEEVFNCFEKCLKHFPEHLHPKKNDEWLYTVDKLNRIEKLPFDKIIEIVEKTRTDNFWSGNFLALPKLRKKNKDGIMYIVYFNEKFKNKQNGNKSRDYAKVYEESIKRNAYKGIKFQ